jgi:GTP-binding protein
MVHDLKPGERIIIAKGGRGGFGNEHFKRSDYQSPKTSEAGQEGQELRVRLELKVIAEVGLLGMPNAGKSTLLASLTKATPKIANYPFTTLAPQLGVCEVDSKRRLVIADIPGLIEGASDGAGLGLDFLRHVERTKVLVHMVDCQPDNGESPSANYDTIRAELAAFSEKLAEKPELVVVTKLDLFETDKEREAAVNRVAKDLGLRVGKQVIGISSASRTGLRELMERVWTMVHPQGDALPGWQRETDPNAPLQVLAPQEHMQPIQTRDLRPATPVIKPVQEASESKAKSASKPAKKNAASKKAAVKKPAKKKVAVKTTASARTSKPSRTQVKKPAKKAAKKTAQKPTKKAAAKSTASRKR